MKRVLDLSPTQVNNYLAGCIEYLDVKIKKNEMKAKYIFSGIGLLIMAGCTDLEPKLDASIDDDVFWNDRDYAMGVLNEAYNQLPAFYTDEFDAFLDCATDNAVTNDYSSGLIRMASGGWTAQSNPLNSWQKCYTQIRNLNDFIEKEETISFSNDAQKDKTIHTRVKGEAFFLRAWYQFELLSRFSGLDVQGNLLGYPIVLDALTDDELKSVSRNSFDDCVETIKNDIDTALLYLPAVQYSGADVVIGATQIGRAYKLPALSLKSRLLLYAASPAYTVGKSEAQKQILWEKAALAAMDAIRLIGTLPTISTGGDIYTNPNHAEIIWRSYQPDNNAPERENFYPSLWGNGRTNPSQQLVDAFPMKDSYPIGQSTIYSAANPYINRDNRFALAIIYNNATFGTNQAAIYPGGKDYESTAAGRATRTGYYLRKFIDPAVVITPDKTASTTKHYYAFFRCGELWLNYAEAANEAWGPTGDPLSLGKTAKSSLAELRKRSGGIVAADPYLSERSSAGKEALKALIQNERRIELCFENHRFFDVRRWLLPVSQLNQPIEGVMATKNVSDGTFTYQFGLMVEDRNFSDYMYYGPLPEQAIYASNGALAQNAGW